MVSDSGKIWVIDNYDSFVFNLIHYVQITLPGLPLEVYRNDDERLKHDPECTHLVISPGPGIPEESGYLVDFLKKVLSMSCPPRTFGVCLGMQALAIASGGKLKNLSRVYHGESTEIYFEGEQCLFDGLSSPLLVGRYHSWVVEDPGVSFRIIAQSSDGDTMAMIHKYKPIAGVQFHPESILTPYGLQIIKNWFAQK